MRNRWFLERLRTNWTVLTIYERFEQIVSLVISLLLSILIMAALWNLISSVAHLINTPGAVVQEDQFPVVFGSIMSLLMALEFNHTIFHSIQHRGQIVRVKTVVLIAILGISREYILLDAKPLHAAIIVGYGISILCLGIVYYVLDIRESSNSSFR
ncbi:phosphate-starvation-inducible PsiE family protein [Acidithiobacillus sp. 'AMD consortium']|uniref:Diguanylate cyclase n=2 Tax=Acidithiobacillus ferrooxidans TaxID=920 RepID=B7JAY3_ACIF2|nr:MULTISPECIES: phosphate-starvation-inducible PsiE family protein [Acidithiobacillus]ACH83579.1 conserved hypothetical protein [Acidithiobacillus ferrooxidans ATCC 53993]ACK79306.1 conserved hypothetical protein [Acidithiobacillus ferrooxidans ATCC 23270]MBN6744447.1 phosphate-starvation-inducible PsiE family protein [Acidithiobacillus sp. MC2.2]MBN6747439.1 phosphate-starvation-inducible PsiE family protein [Acidithiobacillus sp. PG05]MBU2775890.1 phosphate-starvation-inducible PsiE family 